MSIEFRQRHPSEYAEIIRKRKWLIILPAIAIASAISYVVWYLPNVYESTSLLIVRPSTISNAIVPTLSDENLSIRINTIGQEVTSRSSLEPLIERYELYKEDRLRGEPLDAIIEEMRKDITVEIDKSRNDVTNAFRISYRARNPRTSQAITSELAGKYVAAQMSASTNSSVQTKQFMEQQVQQSKAELDDINRRRLEHLEKNVNNLPSQTSALVGQLTGLREQEKALIQEIGRMQDQRSALVNQISIIKKQTEQQITDVAETTTDPKTTLAYAELAKKKAELEAELQNMLTTLKPKNPDVKAKQAQLDSIQREIDRVLDDWEARMQQKKDRLSNRVDIGVANAETNLKLIESDIERQKRSLGQTEGQIADISARINNIPTTEVGLQQLNSEFDSKKLYYDQLLEKKQRADLAADLASNAQGEMIQVIDTANMPETPVAPKRVLLMPLGVVIGLAAGLFLVALVEVPKMFTIQNIDDAVHYTGLPVLVSLPDLWTPQEAARIPVRRTLMLGASVAATIVATPLLVLLLKLSHVFDRFVS